MRPVSQQCIPRHFQMSTTKARPTLPMQDEGIPVQTTFISFFSGCWHAIKLFKLCFFRISLMFLNFLPNNLKPSYLLLICIAARMGNIKECSPRKRQWCPVKSTAPSPLYAGICRNLTGFLPGIQVVLNTTVRSQGSCTLCLSLFGTELTCLYHELTGDYPSKNTYSPPILGGQ